jgi:hypothetical protein
VQRAWGTPCFMVATLIVAAACGPNVGTPTVTPPTATPLAPPIASPIPSTLPGPNTVADSQQAVNQALQNAAAHLSIGAGELRVDTVEARQWPDSSLGCPQPGTLYSQIVTPGFLIVISTSSGKQLEYHSDARGRVMLCKES